MSKDSPQIPFFGARKLAAKAMADLSDTRVQLEATREELRKAKLDYLAARKQLVECGAASLADIQSRTAEAQHRLSAILEEEKSLIAKRQETSLRAEEELAKVREAVDVAKAELVVTEDIALLQEVGVYEYRHPLSDAANYTNELKLLQDRIKLFNKHRETAISATTGWHVNGSATQGARMVSDFSKLMLLAFNAEADTLVRGLKPYKLDRAIERLKKVAATISKLGKTMQICVTYAYLDLRIKELELTADFINKIAQEKEAIREERARLREEKLAQAELERERERLEKEKRHCENVIAALRAKGDDAGALRIEAQLHEVEQALSDVDYRTANVRAGYVYVISNVGAFGESMVKVGMTRRLDPMDRINELGDASVPFRFDVHALFFSKDAVTIENALHTRLSAERVNKVNFRREFFRCTPAHVNKTNGVRSTYRAANDRLPAKLGSPFRRRMQ